MAAVIVPILGAAQTQLLASFDYVVIAIYLVGIIAIGSFLARGQKDCDDYFVAGRRMHWFPLALSIWASLTSANSMLGAPAYAYSQDLQQVPFAALAGLIVAIIVIRMVLPLLHGLKLTTAYTYLERRFNIVVRCVGSLLFILLRGGWLASVIYLPSLALSAVIPVQTIDVLVGPVAAPIGITGSLMFWIVIVGLGATLYTTLGGLKAVIWTDVAQFFVFLAGMAGIWFLLLTDPGATTMMRQLGNIPRAHVGSGSLEVGWGQRVQLDGSESRAFDGSDLSYAWRVHDGSADTGIVLEQADAARATLVAPARLAEQTLEATIVLCVTTQAELPLQSAPAVVKVIIKDDPAPAKAEQPPAYHERPRDTIFDFRPHLIFGVGVTFWMLLFSNFLGRINDAGTDQIALQRYFSARSLAQSKRAIWLNAFCDVPLMPLLFLTGSGILIYYAIHHNPDVPLQAGQAMPFFVAHKLSHLVPGLAGLFIAALFAATMSSVDSGINSLSAAMVTDWYRRLMVPHRDERHYLSVARFTTLVLGLVATFAALFFFNIGEAWQVAVAVMGFWTGPLLGMFLLGFFTTRTTSAGAMAGAAVGLCCVLWFWLRGGNEFLYGIVGLVPTMVIGYVVSLMGTGPRAEQIAGLTTWTNRPVDVGEAAGGSRA